MASKKKGTAASTATTGGKPWFSRGAEGAAKAQRLEEEAKARREQSGPRRFWLDRGASAKVVFLDDPDFYCFEHNVPLQGKFFNYYTCIKEVDNCPWCDAGDRGYYLVAATVINTTPQEAKDGRTFKNQKMLLVCKSDLQQKLKRQREKRGGTLKLAALELTRGTAEKSPSSGDNVEFLGKVSIDKLKTLIPDGETDDWIRPFDYEEVFAPKSAEEMRKLAGSPPTVGGSEDESEEEDDLLETDEEEMSIEDLL